MISYLGILFLVSEYFYILWKFLAVDLIYCPSELSNYLLDCEEYNDLAIGNNELVVCSFKTSWLS